MPADPKPRAWKYMGDDPNQAHGRWVKPGTWDAKWVLWERGDIYLAAEPLTPDDVELVEPGEASGDREGDAK